LQKRKTSSLLPPLLVAIIYLLPSMSQRKVYQIPFKIVVQHPKKYLILRR
jgi:hypothetical protein